MIVQDNRFQKTTNHSTDCNCKIHIKDYGILYTALKVLYIF